MIGEYDARARADAIREQLLDFLRLHVVDARHVVLYPLDMIEVAIEDERNIRRVESAAMHAMLIDTLGAFRATHGVVAGLQGLIFIEELSTARQALRSQE